MIVETKFFDADFRKDPNTKIFCAYCQRDLNPEKIKFMAFLDFETTPTIIKPQFSHKFSSSRKELCLCPIGSECAKIVGYEWLVKFEDIKLRGVECTKEKAE